MLICLLLLSLLHTVEVIALTKSGSAAKGFFVRLHPYSADIYGDLPAALLEDTLALVPANGPQDLYIPTDLFQAAVDAQVVQSVETKVSQMLRRSLIYKKRKEMIEFMAEQVMQQFHLAGARVELFWMEPVIYVHKQLDQFDVSALSEHPHIRLIEENAVVAQIFPAVASDIWGKEDLDKFMVDNGDGSGAYAWGLHKIQAHKAWSIAKGQNVRVGVIDTGVNYLHDALKHNYAGRIGRGIEEVETETSAVKYNHDYAWFDPKEYRNDEWWCDEVNPCIVRECCLEEPFDIIGHGTHVTSTAVGSKFSNGTHAIHLGVAPGAKWMAAKGCRDGMCLKYGLLKSAEWMACPTRINGKDANCELGADVINNSWGSQNGRDDFFIQSVKVWRDMGIIPVFAGGNTGPGCGSSTAPGDFNNVIGVAASDINDQLAKFSSRGPGPKDDNEHYSNMKPDITGPGSRIPGADFMNNGSFVLMSGTSMATPHITGVIALQLSKMRKSHAVNNHEQKVMNIADGGEKEPFDIVKEAMCSEAFKEMGEPLGGGGRSLPLPGFPVRKECERSSPHEYPNLFYGCGRVDALKSLYGV